MPQIDVPRLYRNRCGVWCFRLRSGAQDSRLSLRTKCELTAHILARRINAAIDSVKGNGMTSKNPKLSDLNIDLDSLRRYEIDVGRGVFKATDEADHGRMMDALDRIGIIPGGWSPKPVPAPVPPVAVLKSLPLDEVAKMWLAERAKKNAPRTLYAKSRHFEDFASRIARDVEINAITQATVVGYKSALLMAKQEAKTLDNKLMTLHDLFKFALRNGHYTASNANPVAGLFILTKTERNERSERYQPFTPADLRAFFDPAAYKAGMAEPDFYWCPLLGLYTGMRISEATAIRCSDVKLSENGVHFIFVPKSKTTAGVRNVPVSSALVELGFLDFVAEQRSKGYDRLFPDRLLINYSYSKKLSERMKDYLIERKIKKTGDCKSFHSFRVNVITQLANNGANTPQVMQIVGHKSTKSDDVHLGYVRELPDLKQVLDGLVWPIDLKALSVH